MCIKRQTFPAQLLKRLPFLHWVFLSISACFFFLALNCLNWPMPFMSVPYYIDYYSFIIWPEIRCLLLCSFSGSLFFPLGLLGTPVFQSHHWVCPSSSTWRHWTNPSTIRLKFFLPSTGHNRPRYIIGVSLRGPQTVGVGDKENLGHLPLHLVPSDVWIQSWAYYFHLLMDSSWARMNLV